MRKKLYGKTKLIVSTLLFILSVLLIILYLTFDEKEVHEPENRKKITNEQHEVVKVTDRLQEIKELYKQNSDLVGWIQIDGTKIDYPVMYTEGEDYYLYRDFYKEKYNPGTLFIDKYNTVSPRDTNLIIHGHNMDDGSMFYDLTKYKKKEFYETHKVFKFYTLYGTEMYEIISVFLSQVYNVDDNVFKYYKFYNAENELEYKSYIANIKALSLYKIDATASYGTDLLTLSTCEYSKENGRLVVVAKKIS